MDFETGKIQHVARHHHPSERREYVIFWLLLCLSTVPYLVAACVWPIQTVIVSLFVCYFHVLVTLARSSQTATSHHMRFLLSGNNPVGMTGGSSLLFGAVDAVMDWREDSAERQARPVLFYLALVYKFAMTPIGVLMLVAEFAWDCLMVRHPRLFFIKWNELFSLASYHDLISPEKSNDIFYADHAMCRYRDDPALYQWNRMRSLVFELQQYKTDAFAGRGVAESNLFLQCDVAAYQTLKRLCVEEIEAGLADFYEAEPDAFPFPRNLRVALVNNARPIFHFMRMLEELSEKSSLGRRRLEFMKLPPGVAPWQVLRLLDAEPPYTFQLCRYLPQQELNKLADAGLLVRKTDFEFQYAESFINDWEIWLHTNYEVESAEAVESPELAKVPDYFVYECKCWVRK